MPHLQIQYSKNLEESADISAFCAKMAREIAEIGLYPLGGIRVRAVAQDHVAIADLHPKNAFLDMVFRIGQGRSDVDKKHTGERLMQVAETFFSAPLASGYFMLSLEIVEIERDYSWKTNSVHKRLKRENDNVA